MILADRVKGITIQIGGDTTGLSKALKGVNSDIKGTESQLRDVNRLLKLDPTNTELLQQKQKLLASEIGSTKTKLDSLKAANDQVKDSVKNYDEWKAKYDPIQAEIDETKTKLTEMKAKQEEMKNAGEIDTAEYDKLQEEISETEQGLKTLKEKQKAVNEEFGNPISPEQYDSLQREIIETEQDLEKLEKQARESKETLVKIEEAGKSMENVGEKVTGVGKKMSVLSAGVAGVGTAAVKTTADFDSQMSTVQSITGASAEEFEKLRDKAMEMGESTSFSASEAGQAMEYMAMAGWSTQDMLDGIGGVMDAAAASGEDLALTSDILTDGLTAFGLSAKDSVHFADVLVKTGNSANTSVSMMGETFKYAGAVCGSLGISIEDASIATGLMGNAGIKASQAGTALRTGLTNLVKPSKQAATAMEKYGVEVMTTDDGSVDLMATMGNLRTTLGALDSTEQAAAISAIFGKNAMSGWSAIVNATDDDFISLSESIQNADGAAKEAAALKLDNLNGQITLFKSALEGLMISIGDILMPLIRQIVEMLQGVVDWLNNLSDGQKEVIVTIAGIVAAIGPLLVIFGTLIGTIGRVCTNITTIIEFAGKMGTAFGTITTKVLPALQGAFTSVFSFIAANPIVLLIAAIVGLVVLITKKGTEIKGILTKIQKFLNGIFLRDWTTVFGSGIGDILNAFGKNLSNIVDSIITILRGIIDFVQGVFTGNWEQAWSGVKEIFRGIFDGFASIAKAPLNGVIGMINGVIGAFNAVARFISNMKIQNPFTGKTWGFHIPQINKMPYLAKGGILQQGSAVVGEAGPELLTMQGNQAMVQPLTQSNQTNHNTNLGGVNITVYGAPGQDVRELADIIMDEIQYATDRKAAVFSG